MTSESADGQPWDQLADQIATALEAADLEANVYAAPTLTFAVPAILIRPDEPWQEGAAENEPLSTRRERYAVICIVNASDPPDAYALMRRLALACIAAEGDGWIWESTGMPVGSEDSGITYLGATLRFTFSAED